MIIVENAFFMGYDIVDHSVFSGIRHLDSLGYKKILNQNYLISSREKAAFYKAILNKKIPEHSPFETHALWAIN